MRETEAEEKTSRARSCGGRKKAACRARGCGGRERRAEREAEVKANRK